MKINVKEITNRITGPLTKSQLLAFQLIFEVAFREGFKEGREQEQGLASAFGNYDDKIEWVED